MIQNAPQKRVLFVSLFLALAAVSQAAVTLTFQQVGNDVVGQWSGTYDLPAGGPTGTNPSSYAVLNGLSRAFGLVGGLGGNFSGIAGTPGSSGTLVIGQYTGDTFGFDGTALYWPTSASGTYSPSGTMTFLNTTLAAAGVASYSHTVAFTGSDNVAGSQEIRFHTVPEPSSTLLMPIGAAFCLLSRRRRK